MADDLSDWAPDPVAPSGDGATPPMPAGYDTVSSGGGVSIGLPSGSGAPAPAASGVPAAAPVSPVATAAAPPDLSDWIPDTNQPQGAPSESPAVTQRLNAMSPGEGWLDAGMRGVANAVPFMSDIAALGDTAVSYLPQSAKSYIPGSNPADQSGQTFGQRYGANLALERGVDAANSTRYPVTSTAAPIVGAALALPAAGPIDAISAGITGVAPRLAGLAADSLASGTVGAGYGALYGAGSGTSLDDRLSRAETGAIYGGVGGAAVPAVARGIGNIANAALIPFKGTQSLATNQIANTIVKDRAIDPSSGLSPQEFSAAQASGQPVVAADLGGQGTRRLARTAANASPDADAALQDAVNNRYEDQGPRIGGFLQGLYGNGLDSQAAREYLRTAATAVNTPAYQQAYADGSSGVWTPELQSLLNSPSVRTAVTGATDIGANDAVLHGHPVVRNPFVSDASGNLALKTNPDGSQAVPTLQFWDYVKRGLDNQIGTAIRGGQNTTAGQLTGLKNKLLSSLDNAVPSYKAARAGAFGMFQADNALEAGENFLKMASTAKSSAMKSALAKMTPAQRKLFSFGLASQMAQSAMNASVRRNVINMFNSPEIAQRLQLGLGPDIANQVEAFLRRESIMDRLRTAVAGNSTTTRQASDLESAGHGIMGLAKSAIGSPIAGAIAGAGAAYHEYGFDPHEIVKYGAMGAFGGLFGKYVNGVNTKIMTSIGEQLASSDPRVVNAAIMRVSRNPRMLSGLRIMESALTYSAAKSLPQTQENQVGAQ